MKKLLLTLLLLIAPCSSILAPTICNAAIGIPEEYQPNNVAESWAEQNPDQMDAITDKDAYGATAVTLILGDLISGVLSVIGVVAVFILAANGLKYATSFGQQDKIDQAKKGIMWALAGLMVVLVSYSVVKFAIRIIIEVDEENLTGTTTETTTEEAPAETTWILDWTI